MQKILVHCYLYIFMAKLILKNRVVLLSAVCVFLSRLSITVVNKTMFLLCLRMQRMQQVNKELKPEKMAETMRQFEQQNARMEMTDEMSECTRFTG